MYHGGREHGDPEAGFLDRAGLEEILDSELSRAARHELPVALVMLEVSTGRAALSGDEISAMAKDVAATIKARIRGEDHAARLGPLRFAVVAVETGDSETVATDLAAHVRHALAGGIRNGKALTVSVGAVDCQFGGGRGVEGGRAAAPSLAAAILGGAGLSFPGTAEMPPSPTTRADQ